MHIKEIETLEDFEKNIYKIEDDEYRKGNEAFLINKKWTIGGIGGGSCWDDGDHDPHYELSEQDEPEDNTIEIILKNIFPEISLNSFLEKNELWQFWDEDTDLDCDYYGNYTRFRLKTLKLDILFEKMKEMVK
jgi:hypothetical protein